MVRHGVLINGATHIALTKLDILSGMKEIQLCHKYSEADTGLPLAGQPIYESHPGWDEDITNCRDWASLPLNAQRYVERIEALIGCSVGLVSVGPGRDQVIVRETIFSTNDPVGD